MAWSKELKEKWSQATTELEKRRVALLMEINSDISQERLQKLKKSTAELIEWYLVTAQNIKLSNNFNETGTNAIDTLITKIESISTRFNTLVENDITADNLEKPLDQFSANNIENDLNKQASNIDNTSTPLTVFADVTANVLGGAEGTNPLPRPEYASIAASVASQYVENIKQDIDDLNLTLKDYATIKLTAKERNESNEAFAHAKNKFLNNKYNIKTPNGDEEFDVEIFVERLQGFLNNNAKNISPDVYADLSKAIDQINEAINKAKDPRTSYEKTQDDLVDALRELITVVSSILNYLIKSGKDGVNFVGQGLLDAGKFSIHFLNEHKAKIGTGVGVSAALALTGVGLYYFAVTGAAAAFAAGFVVAGPYIGMALAAIAGLALVAFLSHKLYQGLQYLYNNRAAIYEATKDELNKFAQNTKYTLDTIGNMASNLAEDAQEYLYETHIVSEAWLRETTEHKVLQVDRPTVKEKNLLDQITTLEELTEKYKTKYLHDSFQPATFPNTQKNNVMDDIISQQKELITQRNKLVDIMKTFDKKELHQQEESSFKSAFRNASAMISHARDEIRNDIHAKRYNGDVDDLSSVVGEYDEYTREDVGDYEYSIRNNEIKQPIKEQLNAMKDQEKNEGYDNHLKKD